MRWQSDKAALEITTGDITAQDLDAVVNAANAQLAPGGGVAGAIHRAAGPELWDACRDLGGCATGEAKRTAGFALPARWIIHTVGPVYGRDKPADELLARCYRESLARADEAGAAAIAFPALSTGAFGYPIEEAAEIALCTLLTTLPKCERVCLARFVLFGEADAEVHRAAARRLAPEHGWEPASTAD